MITFLACSLRNADSGEEYSCCARQVFTNTEGRRLVGFPLQTRKNGLLPRMRTSSLLPPYFFHVLVGCSRNGHRLCHSARNIVLSFMLLLLLLNYDM